MVSCAFSLRNVLRATAACTFSTSQLEKVLRTCQFLTHLTWKCASCHNGVQFFDISTSESVPKLRCFVHFHFEMGFAPQWRATFISHLASWLRTCNLSAPTFRPAWATNQWKNAVNRGFPTFSRTCVFFLLSLSLLWSSHFFSSPPWVFTPLLFHLSILSGSLTSKLFSITRNKLWKSSVANLSLGLPHYIGLPEGTHRDQF